MIIIEKHQSVKITAAVFDFDGTLSTLRCGWESVMAPLMEEYISGGEADDGIKAEVRDYIDRSTGVQTILQMKWLAEKVAEYGRSENAPSDPWEYKAEYNRRLMLEVEKRRSEAENGGRELYIIAGSERFLQELRARGIPLFAASGTDECDVRREAEALGLDGYFEEIAGAKPHSEDCSKQAALRRLMEQNGGGGILVVGDGPVEIRLGRQFGALALGVASDEVRLRGYNKAKVRRLTAAGAHALVDCFEELDGIMNWMEG